MNYLERLASRAFIINLSSLPDKDRDELKRHFDEEILKKKELKLTAEQEAELESVINAVAARY